MTSCYALGHYFKKASGLRHYPIYASYPDVSLSLSLSLSLSPDARKRRWGGEKGLRFSFFSFPWSLARRHQSLTCHSRLRSPVTEKLSAWGGGGTFPLFYNQQVIGLLFVIIGSFRVLISRNAFERRTPTASEPFSPLICLHPPPPPNLYG